MIEVAAVRTNRNATVRIQCCCNINSYSAAIECDCVRQSRQWNSAENSLVNLKLPVDHHTTSAITAFFYEEFRVGELRLAVEATAQVLTSDSELIGTGFDERARAAVHCCAAGSRNDAEIKGDFIVRHSITVVIGDRAGTPNL